MSSTPLPELTLLGYIEMYPTEEELFIMILMREC